MTNADKIRIGSPVRWPERQLPANVEAPVAISHSATAVGAVTIETLSIGEGQRALLALLKIIAADKVGAVVRNTKINPSKT